MATDNGFRIEDYPPPAYNADPHHVEPQTQEQTQEQTDENTARTKRLRAELIQLSQRTPSPPQQRPSLLPTAFPPLSLSSPHPPPSDFSSTTGPRHSWVSSNRNLILILTANVPFLIMFTIDITGTFLLPTSAFYRSIVNPTTFSVVNIGICSYASIMNTMWFGNASVFDISARKYTAYRRYQSAGVWRGRLVLVWMGVRVLVLAVGIFVWGWVAMSLHEKVEPTLPSCGERGYGSSVLVQVVAGREAAEGGGERVNNVTVESGGDVVGLSMAPGIPRSSGDGVVALVLDEGRTSMGLVERVRGVRVEVDLGRKMYEFVDAGVGGEKSNGTFRDGRDYYLSFPELGIDSTTVKDWTYVGDRPRIKLVDGSKVVLVGVGKHPRDSWDSMFRMCAVWSVEEMLGDRTKMEQVLVPLGRVGIEMAIWGRGH